MVFFVHYYNIIAVFSVYWGICTKNRVTLPLVRDTASFTQVQPRDFPCMSIKLLQSEILHYRVAR